MTYIDEDRIERRHDFFDASVVDITYGEVVLVAFLARYLLQAVILRQGDCNLGRLYVHNQFAFHTEQGLKNK